MSAENGRVLSKIRVKRWFEQRREGDSISVEEEVENEFFLEEGRGRSESKLDRAKTAESRLKLYQYQLAILEHYFRTVTTQPSEEEIVQLAEQVSQGQGRGGTAMRADMVAEWFVERRERSSSSQAAGLTMSKVDVSDLALRSVVDCLPRALSPVHIPARGPPSSVSTNSPRSTAHPVRVALDAAAWAELAARKKVEANLLGRFLPHQLAIMDHYYCNVNPLPSSSELQNLYELVGSEGKGPLSANMVKRWFKDRSQCAVLDEMSKQGQGGAEEETGSPEERSRLRRGDSAVKGMKVHTRRSTSPKRRGTGVNVFGRFLPDQLRILESHFQQNEKPSDAEVQSILFEIGNEGKGKLSVNMVKRWFKEKRAVGGVLSPATSPLSTSPSPRLPSPPPPRQGVAPFHVDLECCRNNWPF